MSGDGVTTSLSRRRRGPPNFERQRGAKTVVGTESIPGATVIVVSPFKAAILQSARLSSRRRIGTWTSAQEQSSSSYCLFDGRIAQSRTRASSQRHGGRDPRRSDASRSGLRRGRRWFPRLFRGDRGGSGEPPDREVRRGHPCVERPWPARLDRACDGDRARSRRGRPRTIDGGWRRPGDSTSRLRSACSATTCLLRGRRRGSSRPT